MVLLQKYSCLHINKTNNLHSQLPSTDVHGLKDRVFHMPKCRSFPPRRWRMAEAGALRDLPDTKQVVSTFGLNFPKMSELWWKGRKTRSRKQQRKRREKKENFGDKREAWPLMSWAFFPLPPFFLYEPLGKGSRARRGGTTGNRRATLLLLSPHHSPFHSCSSYQTSIFTCFSFSVSKISSCVSYPFFSPHWYSSRISLRMQLPK